MANPKHVALVKKGAGAIAAWRESASATQLDLRGADLWSADLTDADLRSADLTGAHLRGADLGGAFLTGAVLRDADLTDAVLTHASIGWTILADADLAEAIGLADVHHDYPSTVGVDTLARTLRSSGGRFTEEQLLFFTGAGVPGTLLNYLPDLLETNPIQFYSCVISYSTKDDAFASALHDDLEKAGVKTWKWDLDGVVGRGLMENVGRAIHNYDKMILVCSEHSLASKGVDEEIVKALQKEKRL
ncbi:MAG: toll/interleukin-1 receptor domain-containing protein [Dehalococcoidia bacterium]|nr:toll/interleukin-1 receptor domain-containing protein [Dehalococcoidia bacterium]